MCLMFQYTNFMLGSMQKASCQLLLGRRPDVVGPLKAIFNLDIKY